MTPGQVDSIVCPACQTAISWLEDRVQCADCGGVWPVVDGIPRFVSSQHLESFGRQWTKYEVAHNDEDRKTFEAKTGLRLADLKGLRILDAGCGGGRYSKICGEAASEVFGADHTQAVDKAAQLCSHLPNVRFVQADLKRLPFRPATFDIAFSIGVMHHDVDTRAVFQAVAKMVKRGGRYAVWLYRRNRPWQECINNALRKRTTQMDPDRLERWCIWAGLGGIPLVKQTLNKVINFSAHPNFENRVCDTFDWYAPTYQYHHTIAELLDWFESAGFTDLKVLPPEKTGWLYRWVYEKDLLIGSGVNVLGTKR